MRSPWLSWGLTRRSEIFMCRESRRETLPGGPFGAGAWRTCPLHAGERAPRHGTVPRPKLCEFCCFRLRRGRKGSLWEAAVATPHEHAVPMPKMRLVSQCQPSTVYSTQFYSIEFRCHGFSMDLQYFSWRLRCISGRAHVSR